MGVYKPKFGFRLNSVFSKLISGSRSEQSKIQNRQYKIYKFYLSLEKKRRLFLFKKLKYRKIYLDNIKSQP